MPRGGRHSSQTRRYIHFCLDTMRVQTAARYVRASSGAQRGKLTTDAKLLPAHNSTKSAKCRRLQRHQLSFMRTEATAL